jgi:hypothetical protein
MAKPFQVFISHFAMERKIAEEVQNFLKDAFPNVSVFRSSDAYSIATAEGQYSALIDALTAADLMIVLLSSESSRRPWMPFETGFAMGRKIKTFTLLVRAAKPSELPSPFAEMQLRPLDKPETEKIIAAIESLSGDKCQPVAIAALLRGVAAAENALPNVVLKLEPYMMSAPPNCVSFRIIYEGHASVKVLRFTAEIPITVKDPHWNPQTLPGHLDESKSSVDGVDYLFLTYWAGPHASSAFDQLRLRVVKQDFYNPKDSESLFELRFALRTDIDVFQDHNLIRCFIETSTNRTEQIIPMSQIVR